MKIPNHAANQRVLDFCLEWMMSKHSRLIIAVLLYDIVVQSSFALCVIYVVLDKGDIPYTRNSVYITDKYVMYR